MNPLFNSMGGQVPQQNNMGQLLQNWKQFKAQFTGNAQQMVQQLISSGKMSQAQYNQLAQMANQLYPKLK